MKIRKTLIFCTSFICFINLISLGSSKDSFYNTIKEIWSYSFNFLYLPGDFKVAWHSKSWNSNASNTLRLAVLSEWSGKKHIHFFLMGRGVSNEVDIHSPIFWLIWVVKYWNQNTPRPFGVLRDRPKVSYIFGKLVNRAIR